MGGLYVKTSSNAWSIARNIYVKTSSTAWSVVKQIYVKTSATAWSLAYSASGGTPAIQNSAGTAISSAYVGATLYGYPGSNIPSGSSWTYTWQFSTNQISWYTESGTGATGSGTGTNRVTYTTDLTDSGYYIRFLVNYNGNSISSGNTTSITKHAPILNTTSYPTDPVLSGTASVGNTLTISSHWTATTTITNDTLPDYYIATWIANSGTYNYDSRTNSNWSQYTILSGDLGNSISVYVTAYNNGGSTTTGTRTSSVITSAKPANTSAPYWTDTSNNAFSGSITQGKTLRLHFGTWSNSPTYYDYEIFYNDAGGTIIQQNISGTYTQNYVDYTFNTVSTKTIGGVVYAGNSGGLGNVASAPTIGPVVSPAPGAFTYYLSDTTVTPYWPSGTGINIFGNFGGNNTMYVSWNSAAYASYYTDQVSGVTNAGPFNTGSNTSDIWGYSSSGYEYATVTAYNTGCQFTISWTASSNAASYYYAYYIGSTLYSGTTTGTSFTGYASAGSTISMIGVSAWSGANASGTGTGGSAGSSSVTLSAKSASSSGGPFYLSYTSPGVAPSAPSVSGDNSIYPHGGHFYWSSTGTSPIGYVFSIYSQSGSTVYSTYGSTSSATSFAVGSGYYTTSGNYTIYIFASNAYGTSSTTVFSQSMS